jgi:hypothetical protein
LKNLFIAFCQTALYKVLIQAGNPARNSTVQGVAFTPRAAQGEAVMTINSSRSPGQQFVHFIIGAFTAAMLIMSGFLPAIGVFAAN